MQKCKVRLAEEVEETELEVASPADYVCASEEGPASTAEVYREDDSQRPEWRAFRG